MRKTTEMVDTYKIAQNYAQKHKWDNAKKCAAKEHFVYYLLSAERFIGKKIGLPAILRVSDITGEVSFVSQTEEIMWAISQQYPQ